LRSLAGGLKGCLGDMLVFRGLPKDCRGGAGFARLGMAKSLAFEFDFSEPGDDGEGRFAVFYQMALGALKQLAVSLVGGFQSDRIGSAFEVLTGEVDLVFELIEVVGHVVEKERQRKRSGEEGTVRSGGDFRLEDECGMLILGGHENFLVVCEKKIKE